MLLWVSKGDKFKDHAPNKVKKFSCYLKEYINFEFLQASTYQMAVLLQFNTVKRLTMQQLEESTQLKSVRIFCHLIDILLTPKGI